MERFENTLADAARSVKVANPQGLHARPVMRFVDLANQYQSRVAVKKGNFVVDGKNPMEMMLLEATQGTCLELMAAGTDATQAIDALAQLVENGFGEA
ncbi:MAG: HPr family phosphocarrier protein [Phycisphaerales bacterium]|nr:HPr family phosphocarrier protein [Phycisphaerales bacterium]